MALPQTALYSLLGGDGAAIVARLARKGILKESVCANPAPAINKIDAFLQQRAATASSELIAPAGPSPTDSLADFVEQFVAADAYEYLRGWDSPQLTVPEPRSRSTDLDPLRDRGLIDQGTLDAIVGETLRVPPWWRRWRRFPKRLGRLVRALQRLRWFPDTGSPHDLVELWQALGEVALAAELIAFLEAARIRAPTRLGMASIAVHPGHRQLEGVRLPEGIGDPACRVFLDSVGLFRAVPPQSEIILSVAAPIDGYTLRNAEITVGSAPPLEIVIPTDESQAAALEAFLATIAREASARVSRQT
jgi:hypothetical protein